MPLDVSCRAGLLIWIKQAVSSFQIDSQLLLGRFPLSGGWHLTKGQLPMKKANEIPRRLQISSVLIMRLLPFLSPNSKKPLLEK